MNDINNNFLEEDVDYSTADEIIEEIVEEVVEDVQQQSSVINEAMKRIEQANLYKALLDHQLFAPGSARPEIIAVVRKEFKAFILSRLEILLGIKQEAKEQLQPIVQLPFSEAEIDAIKSLAKRLIDKDKAPTVTSVNVPMPKIQSLATQTVDATSSITEMPEIAPQKRIITRVVKKVTQPPQQTVEQPKVNKKPGRPKSNNISEITGEDLGQAVNPALPPKKMPSQAQIDMINAQQAEANAKGGAKDGVGQAITKLLR